MPNLLTLPRVTHPLGREILERVYQRLLADISMPVEENWAAREVVAARLRALRAKGDRGSDEA